jgi:hypothetical protein
MFSFLAVDITGHDIIGAVQAAEWLGFPGVIGALLGLAGGYLLASLLEDKVDLSSIGCIYWPFCAAIGVSATIFAVNSAAG